MPISLQERLRRLSRESGSALFGIADLGPAHQFICGMGGQAVGEYPRAISIGMRLMDAVVDNHSPGEKPENSLYWHHVYNVVTPALDRLSLRIALELQTEGHRAFPIPASQPYNRETLKGVFSHKLASRLAGLGWIGKSSLLLTPDFGPRVRFTSVLTDAPLSPGFPLDTTCGNCRECVVSCPAGAIKNREFCPDEPVEMRVNTRACAEYRVAHSCGICVAKCPRGRPGSTRSRLLRPGSPG